MLVEEVKNTAHTTLLYSVRQDLRTNGARGAWDWRLFRVLNKAREKF
jgi:hypothetical protein